ncbi:hypothetical protein [Thermoanaerobacterium thermosaccharolyticum]|uniref:hypothetical protein n=1 Tax=Thermoanaerobacterium thermosaccharolyticum TaxID=1517 RepID=UPI002FD9B915
MLRNKKGEILTRVLTFPIIVFIVILGFMYIYREEVRFGVAMATREAAREYGVQLGQLEGKTVDADSLAQSLATKKAKDVLCSEDLFKSDDDFNDTQTSKHSALISFTNDGQWTTCTIEYLLPNMFFNSSSLISHDNSLWSKMFVIKVTGSAKYETPDTTTQ